MEVKIRRGEGLPVVRKWWGSMKGSHAIDLSQEPGLEVGGGGSSAYRVRATGTKREHEDGAGDAGTQGRHVLNRTLSSLSLVRVKQYSQCPKI